METEVKNRPKIFTEHKEKKMETREAMFRTKEESVFFKMLGFEYTPLKNNDGGGDSYRRVDKLRDVDIITTIKRPIGVKGYWNIYICVNHTTRYKAQNIFIKDEIDVKFELGYKKLNQVIVGMYGKVAIDVLEHIEKGE